MKTLVSFISFFILLNCIVIAQESDVEEVIVYRKKNINHILAPKSTVLGFYPGFWNPGLKLERVSANGSNTFGSHIRGYLFLFNGIKIEPFSRIYFKKNAPEGAFVQFKLSSGFYDKNSFLFRGLNCYTTNTGMYVCPGNPGYVKTNNYSLYLGGGVSFGYQFLLGAEKRFALDLFGGIQAIVPVHRNRHNWDEITLWFLRAFPLEMGIRLGKAF